MTEVEIPKTRLKSLPKWIKGTLLGNKKKALRQYRYGNFHFREYPDKFTVHRDKFDPRSDPIRHVIYDAPEVLVGVSCAATVGYETYKRFKDPKAKIIAGLVAGAIAGYLGYKISENLKDRF